MHICSTNAHPRPLSASYQHRPSFSLQPGAGVEALFAATAPAGAAAGREEGSLVTATRTNLDLDQDVRREGGKEIEYCVCYVKLHIVDRHCRKLIINWQLLQEVFPYIEIGFRNSVRRTTTACGPNPFWNEELTMPFKWESNNCCYNYTHVVLVCIAFSWYHHIFFCHLQSPWWWLFTLKPAKDHWWSLDQSVWWGYRGHPSRRQAEGDQRPSQDREEVARQPHHTLLHSAWERKGKINTTKCAKRKSFTVVCKRLHVIIKNVHVHILGLFFISCLQVDGTFRLDVPLVLLGYTPAHSATTAGTLVQTATNPLLPDLSSTGHTHLQLFIALEPPLSVLPPIKDQVCIMMHNYQGVPPHMQVHCVHMQFESHEDPHMLQQASVWLKKLRGSFPTRNYTVRNSCYTKSVHPCM